MSMVNDHSAKKLLETAERQLGRSLTPKEFGQLLRGDCNILSSKNDKKEESK